MIKENFLGIHLIDSKDLVEILRPMIREELSSIMQEKDDKLISPASACDLFEPRITKATLASWTKKGWLQDYRKGGRVFYKKSEILTEAKRLKKYKTIYEYTPVL